MNLRTYLEVLKNCTDPVRLREEFKVYDNWDFLLYGDREEVFNMVVNGFEQAPQPNGLELDWEKFVEAERRGINHPKMRYAGFQNSDGIQAVVYDDITNELIADQTINGLEHVGFICFHPPAIDDQYWVAEARAIVDVGEFLMRNGIMTRLPRVDINYVPPSMSSSSEK